MTDDSAPNLETAFQSMRLEIKIENAATRMPLKNPRAVKLIDFGDSHITLEVPSRSFAPGHLVFVDVRVFHPSVKVDPLKVEGKIGSLDSVDPTTDLITVNLTQYPTDRWGRVIELYTQRQNEIMEFLMQAKG